MEREQDMNDTEQKKPANEAEAGSVEVAIDTDKPSLRRRAHGWLDDVERRFDRLQEMLPQRFAWGRPAWLDDLESRLAPTPPVDIIDHDAEVIVRAAVPGMRRENLSVSLTPDSISLSGAIEQAKEATEGEFFRSEIVRGEFSRTLRLPAEVEAERARAVFRDGLLEIVVPKKQPVDRKHVAIE